MSQRKLIFDRFFTSEGKPAVDSVTWKRFNAEIKNPKGEVLFSQNDVEFPSTWAKNSIDIVSSKYFFGKGEQREYSLKQLVSRVVDTITDYGVQHGYFTKKNAEIFAEELSYMLYNQYGAFNSPVWFNVGIGPAYNIVEEDQTSWIYGWDHKNKEVTHVDPYHRPQASACFIISVDDTIEDIWKLVSDSARLFKYGSGVGADWSKLRSTQDILSGGGRPSGPVSFMKVQDSTGGTIKSGGKTRRAAIMQTLKSWHPDILEFVEAKTVEEKKAHALIEQGYDGSFNGPAYGSVGFQNVNQSVRLDDEFMKSLNSDSPYSLRSPATGEELGVVFADHVMDKIAEGTWFCGDPGTQYEDTIQKWHTCKESGPINSSNPCSEYMFLDDSACNLASLNLMKFRTDSGFDRLAYEYTSRVFFTAMEILVDLAGYPSPAIAKNSHLYRPLGLGYANLGALIMSYGLPYDDDLARSLCGALTAIQHFSAGYQSTLMAGAVGPFDHYKQNEESFKEVMDLHFEAAVVGLTKAEELEHEFLQELWSHALSLGHTMLDSGEENGYRNAQFTVLAPTGTIAFMMGCDTTGIEPELGLVKWKKLAGTGDGQIKIVNQTVRQALKGPFIHEDYDDDDIAIIVKYIEENGYAEGAPGLAKEDYAVFDTSFETPGSDRVIHWEGHVRMMAAAQPFISGAISKTINMPEESTTEEIAKAYVLGWELGLKALAIYRNNSKRSQPLNTSLDSKHTKEEYENDFVLTLEVLKEAVEAGDVDAAQIQELLGVHAPPKRRKLPDERPSITRKFSIAGHEGYLHVGLYPDTLMPGEIFITASKQGSTLSGLLDAFATSVSLNLQYGVPLATLIRKFSHMKFAPEGWTGDPNLPSADSIVDYIVRYLEQAFVIKTRSNALNETILHHSFLQEDDDDPINIDFHNLTLNINTGGDGSSLKTEVKVPAVAGVDGPPCDNCGTLTQRSGACYVCSSCGNTTGCG